MDPRYLDTDLTDDETLAEYQHRRKLARRDREDDYAPLCAAPGCVMFDAGHGYCARHADAA
jgi:hypothetical protein